MASGPPYASRRSPVVCLHGAVACTQPLAAAAGLRILQQGGNAVDAAVAVAACMAVTEPCSTGVGGDAFALFHRAADRTVHGMNASGRCAAALSLEVARAVAGSGAVELPPRHAHTVTVPGAIAGWCDAVDRWGTMPVSRLLQPAIELATGGFPVAPLTAHHWSEGAAVLLGHQVREQRGWWGGGGAGGVME
jgi:gamma-glutamyltranspeptidase / glutathione hydrolase